MLNLDYDFLGCDAISCYTSRHSDLSFIKYDFVMIIFKEDDKIGHPRIMSTIYQNLGPPPQKKKKIVIIHYHAVSCMCEVLFWVSAKTSRLEVVPCN